MRSFADYIPKPEGGQPERDPYAGGYMTEHGWFSFEDLGEAQARAMVDKNGHRVWQFPIAYERMGNGEMRPIYRDIPDHVVDEHARHLEGKP